MFSVDGILANALVGSESGALVVFFALVIGHAFADFPLQGDFLARGKNRHLAIDMGGEGTPGFMWCYCLTAHALIHAGFVWMITGNVFLALIELVLHWIFDFAKCEKWTSFHVDQLLHILCKVAYALFLVP